jgi:hypothetical protein
VGIEVVHGAAENLTTKDYFDLAFSYSTYKDDDDEVDYAILEAVGLIKRVETDFFEVKDWALSIIYYHLTELGRQFAVACGMVHPDKEPIRPTD